MYVQAYGNIKSNRSVRTMISANTVPPLTPQIVANNNRQKICFSNGSLVLKFFIAFGTASGSSADYTICLNPGDYFEDSLSVDAISVVSNGVSLTDFLFVTELT